MPGARQPLSHGRPALPRAVWTFSLLKEPRAGSDGAFSALGGGEHCQRGAVLQQWQLLAPWPRFGILAAGRQPGAVGVSVPRAFTPPGYELAAHQHTAPRAANQAVAACPRATSIACLIASLSRPQPSITGSPFPCCQPRAPEPRSELAQGTGSSQHHRLPPAVRRQMWCPEP